MLLLALLSFPAYAQTEVPSNWPLIPSGLSGGDQFRLMVLVRATKDATDTGIATYDSFVQTEINAYGHGSIRSHSGDFKVLGSTKNTDARDHTDTTYTSSDTGVPIYWLNGAKVADDYEDFYDGTWDSKAAKGEDGNTVATGNADPRICTGSNDDGTTYTNEAGRAFALGGNDNGRGKCRVARFEAASGTLDSQSKDVTDDFRYLALSGVFEVGSASVATVSGIAITSTPGSDGEYVAGDSLEFTVTFSEAVTVTGTPRLNFVINDTGSSSETRQAAYDSAGSTSTELAFAYTVADADFDEDGIAVPASPVDLDGGTIASDASGSAADLSHAAIADLSAHKIHVQPDITSVQIASTPATAANGYVTGETIRVAVTWDKKVRVVTGQVGTVGDANHLPGGTPDFRMTFDSGPASGAYSQADGDHTLHFDYVVRPGDYDAGGLVTNSFGITLNGGAITRKEVADDIARFVPADRTGTALPQQGGHKVNVNRPTVSGLAVTSSPQSGDTYETGETIKVGVTFSKAVTVDTADGTPRVEMALQSDGEGVARTRHLDYASGSGTAVLVFEYTIQAGESDDDGIAVPANALSANGGTIRASDGTDALLDHSAPGTDGVFSSHKIDGGEVVAVTVSFDAATYAISEDGTNAAVTVTLSADPEREVAIPIEVKPGNRGSSNDFSVTSSIVRIASGGTSGRFTLKANDDEIDDDGETLTLSFGGLPNGVTAGSQSTASVTIGDNDTRGVIYSPNPLSIDEGKATPDAFTVRLTSQPSGTTRAALSETRVAIVDLVTMAGGIASTSLTFTPSNWATPQSVNVMSAAQIGIAQNETFEIYLDFTGSDYGGKSLERLPTTIIDRDKPLAGTAEVDTDSLVLTYDQDLDEDSVPATNAFAVTVAGSPVSVSAVSIAGKKVTLTLATAAAQGDAVTVSYTVPTTNPIQDPDENKAAALTDLAVTNNTPDTTAPILSTATVAGASLVLTYNERLDAASTPAASDFAVTVAGSPVTVSAVAVNRQTVTLTLAAAVAHGDTVSLGYTVPASNPIQDTAGNDAAALTDQAVTNNTVSTAVALSLDVTSVEEDGEATTITVTGTLDGPPRTSDTVVTVAVGASDDAATEGTDYRTVADLTLTIDAGDTSGTATFSLAPKDDDVDEGDETLSVTGTTTAAGLSVTGTAATIVEDDKRGVRIFPTRLSVTEGYTVGGYGYWVGLNSQPTAKVTVTMAVTGSSDVDVSAETQDLSTTRTLTFTTGNWSRFQRVLVASDHDEDREDDVATVTHAVSGGDYGANSVTAPSVRVTVRDDDKPASTEVALSLSQTSIGEDDDAVSVTVTGTLDGASRDSDTEVTVAVGASGDSATEGTDYAAVADFTLTIDAKKTSGTATFTLTPTDDEAYEGDETLSVTGTTTATGLSVTGTEATIVEDDEEPASTAVALSLSRTSIGESDGAASVTVTGTLDGVPRSSDTEVTIAVGASGDAATAGTDYTAVADLTLTIDAGDRSGTATFTLAPTDDDVDEGDETLSVTGTTTGLSVTGTQATIVEDDERGVTVSTATLNVPEGGTSAYTVVLTSKPTAAVTVTPSVTGSPDVTLDTTSLTFTTGNWATAQTVTVSGAQDGDGADDAATVTHAVSGGDYGANNVTVPGVAVTVDDDDVLLPIVAGGVEITSSPLATHDTYGVNETIAVSVTFQANVDVDTTGGTPYLLVTFQNAGGSSFTHNFGYASGSGTTTLVFQYQVRAADADDDGIAVGANALVLNGGTIRDTADTVDAVLTHVGIGPQSGHRIDGSEVVDPAELTSIRLSTDALTFNVGLSPSFDVETTSYTAEVGSYADAVLRVSATPETGGTVTVGSPDIDDGPEYWVALSPGENDITFTASRTGIPDRTYTVTVTRPKTSVSVAAAGSSTTYRLEDVEFTVTRDLAAEDALAVDLAMEQDRTFLPTSGLAHTVTIPANETSATLTLEAGDFSGGATADGTLTAAIAAGTRYDIGTPGSADVDLVVADPALTVRLDRTAWAFLENAGQATLDIVAETAPGVVLSDAFSLSVLVLADNDSAVNGSDFTFSIAFVTFEAADFAASDGRLVATRSISLTLVNDSSAEGEESFQIQLTRGGGFPPAAALRRGDGTECGGTCESKVIIVDDDSPPPQVTGVKVKPGAGSLTVDWTAVTGATGYKVQWKSGTETFSNAATDDREATVSSGTTTRHTLTGLTDGTAYTVRVIAVRSGGPGDGAASAEVTGTPGLPTLTIADASATEGSAVTFTVTLSPAADGAVTVAYAASDGTATSDAAHEDGADYTAPASDATLTIAAGETSATISVATGADTVDEDDETFTLTLSDPSSNAVLGTAKTATGTIVDDDTDPAEVTGVAFTNAPASGEYGPGDVIEVSVTFDAAVAVTGAPRVRLAMSGTAASARYALYDSTASTDKVLAFRRTVTADDDDADAVSVVANGLELNGGGIVNKGTTVNAVLDHDAVQGGDIRTRTVRGIAITSEAEVGAPAPEDIYGPGEEVAFTVTFAAAVTVDDSGGDPELVFIASDGARQEAAYASGSGTAELVFEWAVPSDVPGEEGSIEVPANTTGGGTLLTDGGLVLNGGTIEDANGRDVNIRHGAYSTDSAVDTTAPAVASGAGGATVDGAVLELAFEKAAGVADHLDGTSVPAAADFAVVVAGSARTVSGVAVDGAAVTLTLASPAGHAQAVTVSYTPGTDPLRDLWGNAAAAFSARAVRNDSPEPALSVGDVTVAEDAGKATFTVTLDVVSAEAVSVDYATSDDSAEAGTDYDEASGTLAIAAGETSGTFEVTVTDDSLGEGDETFTVTLSSPVNATIATATATGTIADDETPTLTIADASAKEGNAVTFTVTLSPAADEAVTVAYAASDGTATSDGAHEDGADYTAPASDATLTIAAGETSATISVATGDDTVDEDDETFTVTLSDPSSNAVLGTAKAATGTIEDDDTDPAEITGVAFTNAPASGEYGPGDAIEVRVTFDTAVAVTGAPRVRLAMSGTAASARYALYDSTASTDRVLAFRRTVTADDDDADAVSVVANGLELNGGGIVNKGTTVNAVLDHDAVQGGDIRTRTVRGIAITSEAEVGAPAPEDIYGPGEEVAFTVTFASAVTVDDSGGDPELVFVASDGARQQAGYASGSGTAELVFEWTVPSDVPGEEGAVEIPANTTGGGTLLTDGGLVLNGGTIEDANERDVNIRHGAYSTDSEVDTTAPAVASGAGGATVDGTELVLAFEKAAGVADHLDGTSVPAAADFAVVVAGSARTVSGVAVDGAAVTLTLASPAGHAQAVTVSYTPGTDPLRDLWGNAAAAFSARAVRNDSPEPALSVGDVTVAEDAGKATFTVALDVVSAEAVAVDYATSDDSAEAGTDYDEASGTLAIAAGEASGTFEVTVTDDSVGEGDEAFTVTLSNPVNATVATATATATIADDETPTLTIADASAKEGNAVTFTVTLSPVADEAVTVAYAASDGTATSDGAHEDGADYTAPASDATLTIAAGQTSATLSIATGGDAVYEPDETFTVTLSDPSSNASLGTAKAATGTIENDDDASTDAALKSLTLKVGGSDVDLTPVFGATTYSYEADVSNTARTVKVAAVSNHAKATIAIAGDDDTTSPGEAALPMAFGDNTVTVTVTAEDGETTQDYAVEVTRALPALAWKKTVHYLGEDAGEVTLIATLTPASIDEVTVDYATQSNAGSTAGEDFTAASGTLTFAAGETEKTVKVTILDDNLYEPHDAGHVLVLLSNATGTAVVATEGNGTLLFMEDGDNDSPPTVTMENVTVAEDAGTMELTLSLSHGVETDGLQYVVASNGVGGTATAGSDYEQFLGGANAVIAIPSRATSATFRVSILDDDLDEDDETITFQWKNFSQYVADDSKSIDVTGTITDDDERGVAVSEGSLTVAEGGTDTYTVVLTSKPTGTVTVTPSLATGSSTDVTFSPASLTFETTDWDSAQTVTVSAAHDDDAAADTATIEHAAAGADYDSAPTGSVSVSVTDDETESTKVTLTVDRASVDEDAEATTVTVTGTLDGGTIATATTVTVSVGASGDTATAGTDYAAVADFTLTIDAGKTSGTATFSLTPTDDDVDEGDEALTVGGTVPAATGLSVTGTTITLAEDDERAVTLSKAALTVTEGGTNTYAVVLGSKPTGTVTVTPSLATGSSSDVTFSPASLTFETTDWDSAQTVTVSAAHDDDALADAATIEHAAAGADYASAPTGSVSVSVTDDEQASTKVTLSVDKTSVDEDAGATTITVTGTLDGGTIATATTVTVSVGDSGDAATPGTDYATVADFTLTIDAGKPSGTATFSLTPTDDDVDEGDEALTVEGTVPAATGLSVTGTTITLAEDDERAVTLSKAALTVTEGGTDTYTVVLGSKPTATVTVTPSLATGSSSDVSVSPSSLSFTITTWNTAQLVTVSAAQDADAEDDEAKVEHAVAGGDYGTNSVTAADVDVTVDDDEQASTKVTLSVDKTSVDEDAEATTVTVTGTLDGGTISTATTVTVSVGASRDAATEGTDYATVADFTLTIDAGKPSGTATFSLTPTDDDVDEGDEALTVEGTVPAATGLSVTGTTLTLAEDDERAVTLSKAALTVTEGSTNTYTVVLGSKPTATVTVTPSVTGNSDVTVDKTSLTFTPENWSTAQLVTVSAAQDADAEDDEATLEHAVAGGDYGTNSVTAADVKVTVDDDEQASTKVTLTVDETSVDEDAEATTITVTGTLDGGTIATATTVTVAVGASGDAATPGTDYATVADFTLTIDAGKPSGTATFSLTPTDDDVDEGDEALTVEGTVPAATGLSVTGTTITLAEDDERAVTLSKAALTVTEGGTDTYTVVLGSKPTATVTVTPSLATGSSSDVSVSPSSLSFTITTWNTAQLVTVSAAQDADAEDDEATLEHAVAGGDYGTNSVTAADVEVTVDDDDAGSTTCPTGTDWCATMTVASWTDGLTFFGYLADPSHGALDDDTIDYGGSTFVVKKVANKGSGFNSHVFVKLDERVPRGSVFGIGGREYTATAQAETSGGLYSWTSSSFGWIVGQEVAVSVKLANFPATGKPGVSGVATVGETVTASTSDISDTDGKTKAEASETDHAYTYQWIRVGDGTQTEIAAATASSYTLTSDDEGKQVMVEVAFSDDDGNSEELNSDAWPSGDSIAAASTTDSSMVTGLNADGSASSVGLSWTAPATGTVRGYLVEVSYDGGTTWTVVEDDTASTDTHYVHHSDMAVGETRHYRVSVIDDQGAGAASDPVEANATIDAAGLTATALPVGESSGSLAAFDLCWDPPDLAPSTLRETAYRTRDSSLSASWAGISWTRFEAGAGAGECTGGVGVRAKGTMLVNRRYSFQMRARYGREWLLSNVVEASAPDATRTLHAEVVAGVSSLSGDTEVPEEVCPAYDDPATPGDEAGSFFVNIGFTSIDQAFGTYEEVTGFDLADDVTLENATAAFASPSFHREVGYRVRITPVSWGDDVVVSVPAGVVTHEESSVSNLASNEFRRTTSNATACAPQPNPAASVKFVQILDDGANDGEWTEGERIRVILHFTEQISVATANGVPSVTLELGSDAVTLQAPYSETWSGVWGSTYKLVFDHVVTGAQSPIRRVTLVADSLALNGGEITSALGPAAALGHSGATKQVQPPVPPPLTATWTKLPRVHPGGGNRFVVHLELSKPATIHARDLRDHAISVTGGAVDKAWKVKKADGTRHQNRWAVRVVPDSHQAVTLSLTADRACDEQGAICTADGTRLSGAASVTISGSAAQVSVADAEVHEAPGAELVFEVTLDGAVRHRVKVDYRTVDGTAVAGEDYTAVNGTLLFKRGETMKTVSVPVLNDTHDEDSETMTLVLSNPMRGRTADGEAVGTIRNTDPMPQAWLARFGRTVADQVIDAVEGRMAAPLEAESQVTVAGQRLGVDTDADVLAEREAAARLEALSDWFRGMEDGARAPLETRALTSRDLLTGSSFALAGGSAETGFGALWGRGAVSRFDGREGALALDGEVASAMLGADFTRGRGTLGVVLSHSRGEGGYRAPSGDGEVDSTLTGVYPWGRYALSERLTAWGVVGYGVGELVLTPAGMAPIETDMGLAMAAVGGRGVLAEAPADGGLELAAVTDAMAVRTTSEEVRGGGSLAASQADVTRLRLGLEGTWRGLATAGGGTFVPSLKLGVRHDGGDAETGFGVDIGAGLAWADRALGIEAALDARGLLTHEDGGFSDRGFAGTLAWDPAPEGDRGPSLRLSQTAGASATGGMEALLRPDSARRLEAANDDEEEEIGRRRFEARLGYGWPAFGGRYTTVPEIGIGLTEAGREVSHSWRLVQAKSAGLVFGVDVEAVRLEPAVGDAEPEHRLVLGLGWRLEGARAKGVAFETRVEAARHAAANDDGGHRIGLSVTARW